MDDRLTFPPVRTPSVLPHPDNLLVTLSKDKYSSSFCITDPLNPDNIPDNNEARATIHALNCVCQALISPFNTPDTILDRPTWLRMIMETLASVHEGFHTMQLAAPDGDPPVNFHNLSPDKLNTVARIYEITGYIHNFCELPDDEQQDESFWTLCIRCVEAVDLPPPLAHITSIMLSNALEARAIRDTLRNQAIHEAVHDINTWREEQRNALIDGLVHDITSNEPDPETLARTLGNLDPRIGTWVDNFRQKLKHTIMKMVMAEPIKDHLTPQAQEILDLAWSEKRALITEEVESRSAQLTADSDAALETRKALLQAEANKCLQQFQTELDAKIADEIQQIKNKSKLTLQCTKEEEEESRSLSLAIRTPKLAKPSPLNITKPKRKKKVTILDLTTPPPGNEASAPSSDMDTDTDAGSTPTAPICRSRAPSPSPFLLVPSMVPVEVANPESIPKWAHMPSPEEPMPLAPVFPKTNSPLANELAAIMTAITGIKTELLTKIEQVNARINKTSGPTDIAGYMAWNSENLAAYKHPGFVDPAQDDTMKALMAANAEREAERLSQEHYYCTILHRFVNAGKMADISDKVYIEKWYDTCRDIFKAMSWNHEGEMSADMDNTVYNAWRHVKVNLNEEGWNIATSHIFEHLTGSKPNISTPRGRMAFNNFSTAYNSFCAEHNFNPTEGFNEIHDAFFTLYSKQTSTPATQPPPAQTTKTVRFTSAPPIETLPKPQSSSPEDFPALQAPSKAPISYASATSAFIPVTRRRRGKQQANPTTPTATTTTKPTSAPPQNPNKPTTPNTPKSL